MKLAETVTFGGSALDRAAHLRADDVKLTRLRTDPRAGVLPVWRGKPMVVGDDMAVTPGWLPWHSAVFEQAGPPVFLGLDDGAPRFACDVSTWQTPDGHVPSDGFTDLSEQTHPAAPAGYRFAELRSLMVQMAPRTAELLATARAILGWHESHRFCARCGAESRMTSAGWQRECPSCGGRHFPRTDPVVIMLITRGNRVLLGRSPHWPDGMYSLLAGFVEPGETIEAAVRREVFEETGVSVGAVDYLSSQPWPFPASLMLGCHGVALSDDIRVEPEEIEDAVWMSREALADAMSGATAGIKPARRGAIAHFLLHHWLADRLD